jgi:hypothetical protein
MSYSKVKTFHKCVELAGRLFLLDGLVGLITILLAKIKNPEKGSKGYYK